MNSESSSQSDVRAHVFVTGMVQGVGFRAWTRRKATALQLVGWVKNRSDGSVEAVVEGPEPAVSEMIEAFHTGPDYAEVGEVTAQFGKAVGDLIDFEIR